MLVGAEVDLRAAVEQVAAAGRGHLVEAHAHLAPRAAAAVEHGLAARDHRAQGVRLAGTRLAVQDDRGVAEAASHPLEQRPQHAVAHLRLGGEGAEDAVAREGAVQHGEAAARACQQRAVAREGLLGRIDRGVFSRGRLALVEWSHPGEDAEGRRSDSGDGLVAVVVHQRHRAGHGVLHDGLEQLRRQLGEQARAQLGGNGRAAHAVDQLANALVVAESHLDSRLLHLEGLPHRKVLPRIDVRRGPRSLLP